MDPSLLLEKVKKAWVWITNLDYSDPKVFLTVVAVFVFPFIARFLFIFLFIFELIITKYYKKKLKKEAEIE